jgi:hypothetical protein
VERAPVDFSEILAHFNVHEIKGDDLMMGIALQGGRVAWPEGLWPRLESLLAAEGLLEPVAGWVTCRVRCGPALLADPPVSHPGDLALVCIPLVGDAPARRWGNGREAWDRGVPAFAIPSGTWGPGIPFHFMFDG